MKIVVLDGHTLNPGDLSWAELGKHGELAVYDWTSSKEVLDRAQNAAIVLTNKTTLSAESIQRLPQMKYIGVLVS